jgi:hypothetical protein
MSTYITIKATATCTNSSWRRSTMVSRAQSNRSASFQQVPQKSVNARKGQVTDHWDALAIWTTTQSTWLSSVQVQASERHPIALMLVGLKSGEPFANLVCTLITCKLSRLCDKLIALQVQNSVSGSRKTSSSKRKCYSPTSWYTTETELLIHKIHKCDHSLTLTHPWKHILVLFVAVLLQTKLPDRLYMKSASHQTDTSVSWKINCQRC